MIIQLDINQRIKGLALKDKTIRNMTVVAASSLLLFACGDNKASSQVSTERIWADFNIESDGRETVVMAELHERDSAGEHLILTGGDYLQVSVLNTRKKLTFDNIFDDAKYQEKVSTTYDNALFTIDFYRKKEGSMLSTVELPQNFRILAPKSKDSYSANSRLSFQIDGVDNASQTDIILTAKCKANSGGNRRLSQTIPFNEVANLSFQVSQLTMFQDTDIDRNKACELDVEVSRQRIGQVANQFANGSRIRAFQRREVKDLSVRLN